MQARRLHHNGRRDARSATVVKMVAWLSRQRSGPIGVDIGSRSVKLLQLDAARTCVCEAARCDLPAEPAANPHCRDERLVEAIRHAREGRGFRGRDAVLCLALKICSCRTFEFPKPRATN